MSRTVAIVLYPGFTALDVVGPYEILRMLPDTRVRFVWHEVGPVVADSGVLVMAATHTFDETPHPDVIVVSGGSRGVFEQPRDKALMTWLAAASSTAEWTTSVCFGAVLLAEAGILGEHRATTHWQGMTMLAALGATPARGERVVVHRDAGLATAAGVSAGMDLALTLAAELVEQATAEAIELAIEYDPDPPFPSGRAADASVSTKARATAIIARDGATPSHVAAGSALLWRAALRRLRRAGRA